MNNNIEQQAKMIEDALAVLRKETPVIDATGFAAEVMAMNEARRAQEMLNKHWEAVAELQRTEGRAQLESLAEILTDILPAPFETRLAKGIGHAAWELGLHTDSYERSRSHTNYFLRFECHVHCRETFKPFRTILPVERFWHVCYGGGGDRSFGTLDEAFEFARPRIISQLATAREVGDES